MGPAVAVVAGLAGLAVGSFLNTFIDRWPREEPVTFPPSRCEHCGRRLALWEMVPVASWVALRGRCRTCGGAIGWQAPLVEAVTGLLFAAVAAVAGTPAQLLLGLGFVSVLVAVTGVDLRCQLIPNVALLTGLGWAALVVAGVVVPGPWASWLVTPAGPAAAPTAAADPSGPAGALVGPADQGGPATVPVGPADPQGPAGSPVGPADPGGAAGFPAGAADRGGSAGAPPHAADRGGAAGSPAPAEGPGGPASPPLGPAGLHGPPVALHGPGLARPPAAGPGWGFLAGSLAAAAAGGLVFQLLRWGSRGGLGFGDVKLAAWLGFYLGPRALAVALFTAALAGGLVAAFLLLSGRRDRRDLIPFGPFLAAGGLVGWFFGEGLWALYLGLL